MKVGTLEPIAKTTQAIIMTDSGIPHPDELPPKRAQHRTAKQAADSPEAVVGTYQNDGKEFFFKLRDDRIISTVEKLKQRIEDRFPDSGLAELSGNVVEVAKRASQRSRWISNPIRWVRMTGYCVTASLLVLLFGSVTYAIQNIDASEVGVLDLIAAVESGINDVIFLAFAIFFLFSLETRLKRRKALAAIHELRSIAHIIDMHQLTKDPERLLTNWSSAAHSPESSLTPLQLNRYLDYCTEMLSLTGKIAAIYVQHFDDSEAVAAVSEVEELTTGLSRKIWQKITMLQQIDDLLEEPTRSKKKHDD